MSKHKQDPLIVALRQGCDFTWTVPDGGNLASMRAAIRHGQTITMSPIRDPGEIQVGDKVLVRWHEGTIFHIVSEIQGGRFLIVNSLGKINGWVDGGDILGRVTQVIEPEPRPSVPEMLDQLDAACRDLIERERPAEEDALRLLFIVDDLRWYTGRFGAERWDVLPRSNKWSYAQNLWGLLKQVCGNRTPVPGRILSTIDAGKQCVGLASEGLRLMEAGSA